MLLNVCWISAVTVASDAPASQCCAEQEVLNRIHAYLSLTVAACLLLQLSDVVTPQQAIDSLKDLRGSRAIQTIKKYTALITNVTVLFQQYNYIHDFRENVAAHLATQDTVQRSVSR
ncbi:hypothetical protein CIB84_011670 [Bambusicola thoracicus]|uniref:Uncharacterized protein n=1 Tax=Bambusicola thoracicus TaxID=9083 RepID=A0A2P4SKF8_BAMTH|nr:hypothetical protein CIB84_011670 [Bambusicola thoracicus]